MTREEKEQTFKYVLQMTNFLADGCYQQEMLLKALRIMDEALEQEPREDAISRQAVLDMMQMRMSGKELYKAVYDLPTVTPRPKMGRCKGCKYFEYDSVAKVDGIPLIVAHEICKKWGDGCKTKEDGYCFLFEPQVESEA